MVPNGWTFDRIESHIDFLSGFAFKSACYSNCDNDIRLLRGDNIEPGALRWRDAKKWSIANIAEYDRYQLQESDLIIAMDRTWVSAGLKIAVVQKTDLPCLLVQRVARIRTKVTLKQNLIKYFFANNRFEQYVKSVQTETAVPHISSKQIKDFPVLLPPLPEQTKIAQILSTWDKAIATVEKLIENSKQQKKALMQQLLTGKKRFKEFGEPTKDGELPEGWVAKNLLQSKIKIIDGDRGKEYPKSTDFSANGYCVFLTAKNVTKRGFNFTEKQFITEEKSLKLRKGEAVKGDIILTTRGTVGNVAFYQDSLGFGAVRINSGMVVVRNSGDNLNQKYLYTLFRSRIIERQIESMSFGSAQPQLTVGIINALKIPVPSIAEQVKISEAIEASELESENLIRALSSIKFEKKALMQQLLTGKRRVKVDTPQPAEATA
ncbi:MAG: type I restriction enzyme S subunit [Lentisphaeria bacterium]|jgi:type I restriction enzyme S subunit